ncbi:putative F-box protein At1g71320 [Arachis hypogaea]|uniref:F-box domain-containing protein n=1 Tax=Arachis hypogaea TaxID=3818 RepID=A0A444XFC7_ARAHY|nr:putative F-box protein At1g71320 [Arachis hypogaea]RYQ88435.1 hypothetical protein Ahy_B09g095626 isoform A [Arachis hypogaea]
MKREAEAEVLLPELVEKILIWLPVKSLIRFRCVSKQWLSLISNSRFANLNYDAADVAPPNKNTRLLYLSSEVPEAHCVDVEASILCDYALQLPLSCRHFNLSILGSCKGFILLRIHVDGAALLLWNPVTGSHKSIPDPDALFSMGLARVLYWLAFKDKHLDLTIVAFDLAGNHLSMVSLPTSVHCPPFKLFAEYLGISILKFTDQKIEIWVMKELSWTKFNVVFTCANGIYGIQHLCFTKGELVATKNNELVKVSNKGVSVESLRISHHDPNLKSVMFTKSLLSLPDEFGGTGEEQDSRSFGYSRVELQHWFLSLSFLPDVHQDGSFSIFFSEWKL